MKNFIRICLLLWLLLPGCVLCCAAQNNPLSGRVTIPAGKRGDGLKAQYFNDRNLYWKTIFRIDSKIDFNWGNEAPNHAVKADEFSIRWTGQLYVPLTGNYTFTVIADDGVRLWIDHQLIIDQWHDANSGKYTYRIPLKGHHFYDLKMEYFENHYHAVAKLMWQFENHPIVVIDQHFLFSDPQESPALAMRNTTQQNKNQRSQAVKEQPSKTTDQPTPTSQEVTTAHPVRGNEFGALAIDKPVILQKVVFSQGSAVLETASLHELDKLVKILDQNPSLSIEIGGHTDNVGDQLKNLALSEQRAQTVREYLIRQGIDGARITTRGYGGSMPIASNSFEKSRKKNRRVEFTLKQ